MAAGDTVRWLGVDGNLANTANYSTGALPGADENMVFDAGSISITSNLTALSAIALRSVSITPGFTGNMGGSGQSIVFLVNHANSTFVRVSMGGSFIYASITYSGTGDVTIGSTGNGTFYYTGGSFASEELVGGSTGRVVVLTGVTMGNVSSAGASMDIYNAFTTATFNGGGNNVLRADVTTLNLGTNTSCTLKGTGVDMTTANCYGGSRLILDNARTAGGSDGVVTTINAFPGSYQANSGNFDNYVTTLNQWVGSTQVFNQPNAKTTVATTTPKGQK